MVITRGEEEEHGLPGTVETGGGGTREPNLRTTNTRTGGELPTTGEGVQRTTGTNPTGTDGQIR